MLFSHEAQGYLIQLAELGLLDDRDMETVIERAMISGYERAVGAGGPGDRGRCPVFPERPAGPSGHSMLNNEDTIH